MLRQRRCVATGDTADRKRRSDGWISSDLSNPILEEEKIDNIAQDACPESENDAQDLAQYLRKLLNNMRVSPTVRNILLKQFNKSKIVDQLEIISSLEDELCDEDRKAMRVQRQAVSSSNQEDERESESDEVDESFLDQDEDDASNKGESESEVESALSIDEQWSSLLSNSELSKKKKRVVHEEYCAQTSKEAKFNMLMEFSSYLRPMTQAGKDYLKLLEEQETRGKELSGFFSSQPTTSTLSGAAHGSTLEEQMAAYQTKRHTSFASWLFPGIQSTPVFITTVITTLALRFILGMYVTD